MLCINILSDAYSFPAGSQPAQPKAPAAARSRDDAAAGQASRVAIAGATGYTGQELLRLLGRHPAVSVTAAMSSGSAGRIRAAAARAGAPLGRPDHAAVGRHARARRRHRVSGAARFGRGGARPLAGRGRRARHRSVRRVPAAGRRRARALVSGNAPHAGRRGLRPHRARARRGRRRPARGQSGLLPDGGAAGAGAARVCRHPDAGRRHHRRRQIGGVRRRQDAVGADAFFRVPRQPFGLRGVQPPPRRRNRAGDRRCRSPSRRICCRSTAA